MISIVPSQYAITILAVAVLDTVECIACKQGLVAVLYNLLDAMIVVCFAIAMNVIYSKHKYAEFSRKEELKLESSRDTLTQLYNRRYIQGYYEAYAKPEDLCAMLVLDLDNFKMANDVCGHQTGDEVLCTVSEILRKSFRGEDCVARLGGDEFAIFLPSITKREVVLDRIRSVLGKFPIVVGNEERVEVSVSIGIAYKNPGEAEDYTWLCNRADEAMYRAKKLGKGKAVVGAERNKKELVIEV
jgi:putative two-component system response regulator